MRADNHEELALMLAIVTTVLIAAALAGFWFFPLYAKAWCGWALRPLVGFGTWMLLIGSGIYIEERILGPTFLGTYLRWLCSFAGVFLAFGR